MKQLGSLSQIFEMVLRGVELPGAKTFEVPEKTIKANMMPKDHEAVTLTITIDNTTEDVGKREAQWAAERFFYSTLVEFAEYIEHAVGPRPTSSAFTVSPNASVPEKVAISVTDTIRPMDSIALSPMRPIPSQFDSLRQRFRQRLITQEIPTSAQLYRAREMFMLALQAEDKVVRFLILYSAITLAELFVDSRHGAQQWVDKRLLEKNPTLPVTQTGKDNKDETLYTKIRNDFIHSEGENRTRDLAAAIVAMERHVAAFQRDVARVLDDL